MTNREINALIAEKVMGFKIVSSDIEWQTMDNMNYVCLHKKNLPNYCEDISAAWEVVEKIKDMFKEKLTGCDYFFAIEHCCYPTPSWEAGFKYDEPYEGEFFLDSKSVVADTAPMAICLTALKAVGIDIEGEK